MAREELEGVVGVVQLCEEAEIVALALVVDDARHALFGGVGGEGRLGDAAFTPWAQTWEEGAARTNRSRAAPRFRTRGEYYTCCVLTIALAPC